MCSRRRRAGFGPNRCDREFGGEWVRNSLPIWVVGRAQIGGIHVAGKLDEYTSLVFDRSSNRSAALTKTDAFEWPFSKSR